MRCLLAAAAFVVVSLLSANAQQSSGEQQPELNARDVFWSASDLVGGVAPNPAAKAPAAPAPPPRDHRPPPKPRKVSANQQIDPKVVAANGFGAQPVLVRTSLERLGIRYTIMEKDAQGGYSEVLPSTAFHNGDRVKISAMANTAGYLYLIQQGSSGAWSSIFPGADAARDSNRVAAGQIYQIPAGDNTFEFTGVPGKEKLFIVFSRQPINDLDELIFGLRQPAKSTPAANSDAVAVYEAKNTISDALVQKLASRDLTPVREQVTDSSGSGSQDGEKAVYVVSATATSAADSRVIASFELNHQ